MGVLLDGAPPMVSVKKCERACQLYNEEKARVARLLLERGASGVGKPRTSLVALVLRWVRTEQPFFKQSEDSAIGMLDLLLEHGFTIHVSTTHTNTHTNTHTHTHTHTHTRTQCLVVNQHVSHPTQSEPTNALASLIGFSSPDIIHHLAATQDLKTVLGDAGGRAAVLLLVAPRGEDRYLANMRVLFAVLNIKLDGVSDPAPVHMFDMRTTPDRYILREMVNHGADINARNSEGRTIAHRYVLECRTRAPATAMLREWQRLGLDFSLRDARGRTPADAYREWREALTSYPYYLHEQKAVLKTLQELQAECERHAKTQQDGC
jgi:hypothetical protein